MGVSGVMVAMAATQAAGGALSAAGQWSRASEEHRLAMEQVRFDRMQAKHVREVGAWQEGQHRMQAGQMAGAQRLALATSGFDPSVGTAAQLQQETAILSDLDAAMIRTNAARQAWGMDVQAEMDTQMAGFRRRAQRQQAGMTLLGGLTDAGMTIYRGLEWPHIEDRGA